MTDQELREQAKVMLAYANAPDGKKPKLQVKNVSYDDWLAYGGDRPVLSDSVRYRLAPSPIAPGHNPDKLTVDQIPEGRRLMTEDEVKRGANLEYPKRKLREVSGILFFNKVNSTWIDDGFWGSAPMNTYCVPIGWVDPLLPKTKIADGFNPAKVTENQLEVSQGWRLISNDEFESQKKAQGTSEPGFDETQHWNPGANVWSKTDTWSAYVMSGPHDDDGTLRTQNPPGYYLPKSKKLVRKPCGPEHFPPGTVVREITDYEPCKEWWAIICMTAHWLRIGFQRDSTPFDSQTFMNLYERSLDNGKTWLPCYVEVEE